MILYFFLSGFREFRVTREVQSFEFSELEAFLGFEVSTPSPVIFLLHIPMYTKFAASVNRTIGMFLYCLCNVKREVKESKERGTNNNI